LIKLKGTFQNFLISNQLQMQLSKMWRLCLVLLLGLALGVLAEDTTTDKPENQEASATSEGGDSESSLDALAGKPSAYLLALKEFRSPGLFEGRQTLFFYTLFNVGQSAALEVTLTDDTLTEEFSDLHGLTSIFWERIAPGANVSHSVIASPKHAGFINTSHAIVSYRPSEDLPNKLTLFTTSPGRLTVQATAVYKRTYETHWSSWLAFALLSLPVTFLPIAIWRRSAHKYNALAASSSSAAAGAFEKKRA
jgi:translocon-associated protein subunit beta